MFSLTDLIVVALCHWLGDFVLQSSKDAQNKGHDVRALAHHVGLYTLAMIPCGLVLLGSDLSSLTRWIPLTFVLHFATDAVTARWTGRFWKAQAWRPFFVTVGLDQAIHLICIAVTTSALRAM